LQMEFDELSIDERLRSETLALAGNPKKRYNLLSSGPQSLSESRNVLEC